MNEWRVLVLFIGMMLAFWGGTRWDAAKVQAAENELTAYQLKITREANQQKAAQLAKRAADDKAAQQRESENEKTLESLQRDNDRLADRLRTERVRRICTAAPAMPAASASNSAKPETVAGEGQLSEAAGIDLLRLARDADQVTETARSCQADLKTAGAVQ